MMLSRAHENMLAASGISADFIAARGYRTITTRAEAERLGFTPVQRRVPALVIPIFDVHGELAFHQLRPDSPRLGKNGKPIKYETPAGSRMVLDVPAATRQFLGDPKVPLFVTEGSKKVDSATSRGLVCVGVIGVWSWRGTNDEGGKVALADWESIALNGREVFVVFDSDVMTKPQVYGSLVRLKAFIESRGADVRLCYLPAGPGGVKAGLDDYFAAGNVVDDLLALATSTLRQIEREETGRPTIVISADVGRVVDQTEAALLSAVGLEVYQRAGSLVRVVRDGSAGRSGLKREPSAPVIGIVPTEHLFELAASAASWVMIREREEGPEEIPALPPRWAIQALEARSSWRFRALEAIVEAPCLRPDGSVLDAPGYDAATGILFEPSTAFEPVAEWPMVEDARAALALLVDVLGDFPFLERSDRAAAIAAILTPFARPAVQGPAPLFAIRAPTAGTGKSLLAHVVAIIATGRRAAIMSQVTDSDEERKRVLSIGLEGERVVLIDNVEKPLGSDVLAAALTGTTFKDRLLGTNRTAEVPLCATWFASGNNLVVRGDLGRRVVPIDLDARMERPESRSVFRHADLLEHVRGARPAFVRAALTILRAFLVNATERIDVSGFGSFEGWSGLVRASLVWLGEPDPCAGRERIRADSDPELTTLREALTTWHEVLGDKYRTVAEVVDFVRSPTRRDAALSPEEKQAAALRETLAALDFRSDGERIDARRLGYALRKYRGRILNGLRLEGTAPGKHGVRWRVRTVESGGDGGDGDDLSNPSREDCNDTPADARVCVEGLGGSSPSSPSSPGEVAA